MRTISHTKQDKRLSLWTDDSAQQAFDQMADFVRFVWEKDFASVEEAAAAAPLPLTASVRAAYHYAMEAKRNNLTEQPESLQMARELVQMLAKDSHCSNEPPAFAWN